MAKDPPKPSPAHERARKEFEKGKSPKQTRDTLDRERRQERVKPVDPKKK
jgi:hypothetical protein